MLLKVVVADDLPARRAAVMAALGAEAEIEVVGQATLGADVLAVTRAVVPDGVLIAASASTHDLLRCVSWLSERHPEVKIIVISASIDRDHIETAFQLGACGYVRTPIQPSGLAAAIRRVVEANAYRATSRQISK
jgi:DNA-binding NarL/FixJ family response regulator